MTRIPLLVLRIVIVSYRMNVLTNLFRGHWIYIYRTININYN
nr:MAG TPA: hypothetical protein [Caudoviricetes sp.]